MFWFCGVTAVLFGLILPIYSSKELARGKPTEAREQYAARSYWNAPRVVDGDTNTNVYCNSCLHTEPNNRAQAWWQVNLEDTYTISRVEIFNRQPYDGGVVCTSTIADYVEGSLTQESDRLKGYSIILSNRTSFVGLPPCYKDPSGDGEYPHLLQNNTCFGIGSYLTIFNNHRATFGGINGAALVICEVKVYGCEIGSFGDMCDKTCPNCVNRVCFADNGTCVYGCEVGWLGVLCDRKCDDFWYGQGCSMRCGNCKGNQPCLFTNGTCLMGCADGWLGSKCLQECPPYYYGENCKELCGLCRNNVTCAHTNGSCPQGCENGYMEAICKTRCNPGTYGNQCQEQCGNCLNAQPCDFISGNCTNGCAAGSTGQRCKTACGAGTYGLRCESICGNCYMNATCDIVDGTCPRGCRAGYRGEICKDVCLNGTYGSDCAEQCGQCLAGAPCNIFDGSCTYGCADGWSGTTCQRQVTQPPPPPYNPTGLIIAILVIIVVASVIAVLLWRRKKSKFQRDKAGLKPLEFHKRNGSDCNSGKDKNLYENVGNANSNSKQAQDNKKRKTSLPKITMNRGNSENDNALFGRKKSAASKHEEEQIYTNVSMFTTEIPIADLKDVIPVKTENGVFKTEFGRFPNGAVHPHDSGKLPENKLKNRFLTTYPYGHSMAKLSKINDKLQSDYINANYIQDVNKPNVYIASQGPKKCTLFDFWRMVWENNVGKIVMLTNLVEGVKTKCILYWPDTKNHPLVTEYLEIRFISETIFGPFTLRTFRMTNKKENEARDISHYHFTAWPDHGVPDHMYLLLFHHIVSRDPPTLKGPTIVHCSAGIGRTGSYIALDALLRSGNQTGKVDVFDFVNTMRKDRMNMIQTLEQYIMVHECLREGFHFAGTSIPKTEFLQVYKLMTSSGTEESRCRKEFNTLNTHRTPLGDDSRNEALMAENIQKNRSSSVLPDRRYRPFLLSQASNQNNYINAVMLPGMKSKNAFVATQYPLPQTIADFWYLVYDIESDIVVVLEPNQEDIHLFPTGDETLQFGNITIQEAAPSHIARNITERKIVISSKDDETPRHIKILETPTWPWKADVPKNHELLLNLVKQTNQRTDSLDSGPVTVVCFDGAKKCGLFCAVCNVTELLKETDEIDILFVVRQLQLRRPEFFENADQYEFLYKQMYHQLR